MTTALGRLVEVNPSTPAFDSLADSEDVTFMPLEAVWPDGLADTTRRAKKSAVASGYTRFDDGDILLPKITPTFEAGRVALATLATAAGAATTEVHVLRARPEVDRRYVTYVCRSEPFLQDGSTRLQGVGNLRRVPTDFIRQFPVEVTELAEQRAIADFLDEQTSRIDTLIGKQNQLIETLRERRAAVLATAFRGEGFPMSTLQRACIDVVDCVHTTPEIDEDGVYEAVRTGSVRDGLYRPELSLRVSRNTWKKRNSGGEPRPGDILFTREAPAGEACMVPPGRELCLGQRMVLLRVDATAAVGKFLMWQIYSRGVQDYFRLRTNGSTVGNLRLGTIRQAPIFLPTLDVQRHVSERLDNQTSKIDTLVLKAEEFIGLARERRSALITAAVTGQIDVRTAGRAATVGA